MNAIRQKVKRTGNKVIIDLPDDFKNETFELILVPIEDNPEASFEEKNEWINFSIQNLERLYEDDEVDYTSVLVKEINFAF